MYFCLLSACRFRVHMVPCAYVLNVILMFLNFFKCYFNVSEFHCVLTVNVLMFVVKSVPKVIFPNTVSRLVVRDSQNRLCFSSSLRRRCACMRAVDVFFSVCMYVCMYVTFLAI